MFFWKKKPPDPPNIRLDETGYLRWVIKYSPELELYRLPYKHNLDKFSEVCVRQALEDFSKCGGTPDTIFERFTELCEKYAEAAIPATGLDGRKYLSMSGPAQDAIVSVITRIECAKHLLLYKYKHREASELISKINQITKTIS